MSNEVVIRDLAHSGVSRTEIHGFYESLGFDKKAKQAFVITAR